jgi:ribosomal protein L37AE/L43A
MSGTMKLIHCCPHCGSAASFMRPQRYLRLVCLDCGHEFRKFAIRPTLARLSSAEAVSRFSEFPYWHPGLTPAPAHDEPGEGER